MKYSFREKLQDWAGCTALKQGGALSLFPAPGPAQSEAICNTWVGAIPDMSRDGEKNSLRAALMSTWVFSWVHHKKHCQ